VSLLNRVVNEGTRMLGSRGGAGRARGGRGAAGGRRAPRGRAPAGGGLGSLRSLRRFIPK
jgi:hypothetical protein